MLNLRLTAVVVALSSVLGPFALIGCEDEPATGSCERIIDACHEKDTGSGVAHDCHEAAEAEGVTNEACAELEEDCLAGCAD